MFGEDRLFHDLWPGTAVPEPLRAAVDRLGGTAWPEVVGSWSRLTPNGCPVELVAGAGPRWTTEVAGPEFPDSERLSLAAELAGLPSTALLAWLHDQQRGVPLRFGAWLGGPSPKVYAELTGPAPPAPYSLPIPGAMPRMLALDPVRGRTELYLALPPVDPAELGGVLGPAARCLASLPDGLARLRGRRLGLSACWTGDDDPELALFASARTLFPAAPSLLHQLVPALATVTTPHRLGLVTFRLNPAGLAAVVGLSPVQSSFF
ncbi:hypothetical protein GCM10022247_72660 [Allokutzneria multivorans]|uniref:Uncharacterized protein n=1 Tax=Allokutzneria multivorans TaxID=1142134 RepID=A0ABP7U5K7_9PSEU